MGNEYRRPVCGSTVHSPTSCRIVDIQLTGDDHDGHRNIVNNIALTAADATREPTARDAGRSGLFIQQRTRTAAAAHAIVVAVVGVVVAVIRHGTDRNRASIESIDDRCRGGRRTLSSMGG